MDILHVVLVRGGSRGSVPPHSSWAASHVPRSYPVSSCNIEKLGGAGDKATGQGLLLLDIVVVVCSCTLAKTHMLHRLWLVVKCQGI